MTIQAVLEDLVTRLRALEGLKAVELWDGAWDALKSPTRVSLRHSAALVSLIDLEIATRGLALAAGQLTARPPLAPAPIVRAEIAVTLVTAQPSAPRRAAAALALAERAIPILVEAALTDVTGTNLYSEALAANGLTAFALVGRRDVALAPTAPARQAPAQVDAVRADARETVYPEAGS